MSPSMATHFRYKFTTFIGFCFVFFQDDEPIDAEIEKSVAPRIVYVGRLANLNPVYIVAEGMIVCQLCNLSMGMSIALLLGCYYIFNMKYPSTSKNFSSSSRQLCSTMVAKQRK